jgi:hypothetical protein
MANEDHLAILKGGVAVWNKWRIENPNVRPHLMRANLTGVDLTGGDFTRADLSGADLSWAILTWTNFCGASLMGANLSETILISTNLKGADIRGTRFSRAIAWSTNFSNINLDGAKGLNTMKHIGPSTVGIDTIYRSNGNIPEVFLRGTGIPDNFIEYMHSLSDEAIQFCSCFISYSSNDEEFAERLNADLQSKGIRCWFSPGDMKIDDKLRVRIDESIRMYDKLLLIISQTAVADQWIEQEVETALAEERKQKRTVLFPIRLDNSVTQIPTGWPALIRNSRHIGDFTNWRNHDFYQKAFSLLLRHLKAEGNGKHSA